MAKKEDKRDEKEEPKKKKEALSELMLQIYVLAIIMNEPLQ